MYFSAFPVSKPKILNKLVNSEKCSTPLLVQVKREVWLICINQNNIPMEILKKKKQWFSKYLNLIAVKFVMLKLS